MPRNTLTVKGLPAGWRVLQMARSQVQPSDAIVLCEREPQSQYDMNFVTWRANLELGGCVHGNYYDNFRDADDDFNRRKRALR